MQFTKTIASLIFSAAILVACNSNHSTNASEATDNSPASTGSGKDMYYEYTSTASGRSMSMKTDTKMYVSSGGDVRVEMNTNISFNGKKSSVPIVTIAHSEKPNETISIDDDTKTYSVNHFNDNDLNTGEKITSSVTKIGEEKILGFKSVHARIISTKNIGYSSVDTLDLWKSNDVPIPASVQDLMDKFESKSANLIYASEVVNQLKQMGCVGFMTKMEIHSKTASESASTTEVLVKAEHRDLPASMFQIPAGYKEDKSGL